MSTFTSRTFTQVFDDARAIGLLNDSAKDVYTDAVLLSHGARAHFKIQEKFAIAGIPFAETVSDAFDYTANAETIPVPGAITDFREPLELWEKGTADSIWLPMKRFSGLRPPFESNDSLLYVWEWQNGAIRVLPCSVNRDVFVRYRRQLAYPVAGSTVDFDGIYQALVSGTAFYAATQRPDVQAKAAVLFADDVESAIRLASRDRQGIVFRQKPWGYRPRRRIVQEPVP